MAQEARPTEQRRSRSVNLCHARRSELVEGTVVAARGSDQGDLPGVIVGVSGTLISMRFSNGECHVLDLGSGHEVGWTITVYGVSREDPA
jgi:hypothetical protein